ncbi:DinB family protein [Prosthecomicrobium pneumaticum]|uniref:Putative damage-inducible protein DinB n=1 Tax=Prosthecomicrobium pneumaticum TaxID=81895 RepID=A0A7W9CU85_9HYPH|nr:putative damage-inducible protein DinB [Prosthecomicrobium pneumaticum]
MTNPFVMLAGYNAWANRRLYAAAGALDDADYRADRGAFFGSLHGTLSHLLVTDRIWMRRFTGDGPLHLTLDEQPYSALAALAEARFAEDARILAFAEGLDATRLAGLFTYRTVTNPRDITQPLAPALFHLFNHQTHHRGQAHAVLTAIGGRDAAPSLDLLAYQRETGIGMS